MFYTIVCSNRWQNATVDVETKPDIAIDTDHAIGTADIRIKLGQSNQQKQKIHRYLNPNLLVKTLFNADIR